MNPNLVDRTVYKAAGDKDRQAQLDRVGAGLAPENGFMLNFSTPEIVWKMDAKAKSEADDEFAKAAKAAYENEAKLDALRNELLEPGAFLNIEDLAQAQKNPSGPPKS